MNRIFSREEYQYISLVNSYELFFEFCFGKAMCGLLFFVLLFYEPHFNVKKYSLGFLVKYINSFLHSFIFAFLLSLRCIYSLSLVPIVLSSSRPRLHPRRFVLVT